MDEPKTNTPTEDSTKRAESERTKRVEAVGWTAGLSAFALVWVLAIHAAWPVVIGVIAIAAMVAAACYFMLK